MDTHVKIVAILNIVFGGLGVLGAICFGLLLGGAASIVGITAPQNEALVAIPILGVAGAFLIPIMLLFSLPALLGGIGLLQYKNWARVLVIVLSVIGLLNFPFGTLISIYSLWALLNNDTARLFDQAGVNQTVHT